MSNVNWSATGRNLMEWQRQREDDKLRDEGLAAVTAIQQEMGARDASGAGGYDTLYDLASQRGLTSAYSVVPEVQNFLKTELDRYKGKQTAEMDKKTQQQMLVLAETLGQKEEFKTLAEVLRARALSGDTEKYDKTLEQMGAAGQDEVRTAGDIRLEGKQQEGREDLQYLKSQDESQLSAQQHQQAMELERLRIAGRAALEATKASKKGGKSHEEVKGLMDLNSAFDQLKEKHDSIWTGPVGGMVGRANVMGTDRAGFNSTRAYLLKNVAKAFEGARMSDVDMKFYDKMIPKDTHTTEQFDEIRTNIMNLVNYRVQRYNENLESGMSPDEALEAAPMMPPKANPEKANSLREKYGY